MVISPVTFANMRVAGGNQHRAAFGICDAAAGGLIRTIPRPFGLSLSKPCLFFCSIAEERQPFDKLRANGIWGIGLNATRTEQRALRTTDCKRTFECLAFFCGRMHHYAFLSILFMICSCDGLCSALHTSTNRPSLACQHQIIPHARCQTLYRFGVNSGSFYGFFEAA